MVFDLAESRLIRASAESFSSRSVRRHFIRICFTDRSRSLCGDSTSLLFVYLRGCHQNGGGVMSRTMTDTVSTEVV